MLTLEVLECDLKREWPFKTKRVVPAEWWVASAVNAEWVEVCCLHWWQCWRLLRLWKRRHYWPLRLRRNNSLVWVSKAAEEARG